MTKDDLKFKKLIFLKKNFHLEIFIQFNSLKFPPICIKKIILNYPIAVSQNYVQSQLNPHDKLCNQMIQSKNSLILYLAPTTKAGFTLALYFCN